MTFFQIILIWSNLLEWLVPAFVTPFDIADHFVPSKSIHSCCSKFIDISVLTIFLYLGRTWQNFHDTVWMHHLFHLAVIGSIPGGGY